MAWKNGSNFLVWTTDSNGNYISETGSVSGNSYALESLEQTFNQDLNGDGTIGLVKTLIQTDGSTSLTEVANNYFLYAVGGSSGPALKFGGAAVAAGEFGGWTPIGAVQTSTGYEVAWKDAIPTVLVWTTDSNGNSSPGTGDPFGVQRCAGIARATFNQDLNGDGVIGLFAAPSSDSADQLTPLAGTSGSATIGTGATLELAAADSASITFGSSTGMLELDSPSTFSGTIFNFTGNGTLSGSDQIDLKGINFNSVHDTYANGVLTVTDGTHTDKLDFNGSYTLANFKFASDGSGGTIVYDPPVSAVQSGNRQRKI